MKAAQSKTHILTEGFLNGFNLFPFPGNRQSLSDLFGSLKIRTSLTNVDGLQVDWDNIKADFLKVNSDIISSFNTLKNGMEQPGTNRK